MFVTCPYCTKEISGKDVMAHLNRCHRISLRRCGFASRSKYRNVKTASSDGIVHASNLEAERWMVLKELQRLREISCLRRQVRYALRVNGHLVCRCVADFIYRCRGKLVIEDTKGFVTPEFSLKEKLFFAITGIKITRVTRKKKCRRKF